MSLLNCTVASLSDCLDDGSTDSRDAAPSSKAEVPELVLAKPPNPDWKLLTLPGCEAPETLPRLTRPLGVFARDVGKVLLCPFVKRPGLKEGEVLEVLWNADGGDVLRDGFGRDCTLSWEDQVPSPLGHRLASDPPMAVGLCAECSDWPGAVGCVNFAPSLSQLLYTPDTPVLSLEARPSVRGRLVHMLLAPPCPVPFSRGAKRFVALELRFGCWP